jgi:hypothetical protein
MAAGIGPFIWGLFYAAFEVCDLLTEWYSGRRFS